MFLCLFVLPLYTFVCVCSHGFCLLLLLKSSFFMTLKHLVCSWVVTSYFFGSKVDECPNPFCFQKEREMQKWLLLQSQLKGLKWSKFQVEKWDTLPVFAGWLSNNRDADFSSWVFFPHCNVNLCYAVIKASHFFTTLIYLSSFFSLYQCVCSFTHSVFMGNFWIYHSHNNHTMGAFCT